MLKLNEKQQLTTKSLGELETLAGELEKEIMKSAMAIASRQTKNVREAKKFKHKLAVVKTLITLKKKN